MLKNMYFSFNLQWNTFNCNLDVVGGAVSGHRCASSGYGGASSGYGSVSSGYGVGVQAEYSNCEFRMKYYSGHS